MVQHNNNNENGMLPKGTAINKEVILEEDEDNHPNQPVVEHQRQDATATTAATSGKNYSLPDKNLKL